MNAFDFRWCVKALKRIGMLPVWVRHYDLHLYDHIYDLSAAIYGDGNAVLPGHQRLQTQPIILRHGMHYALQHQAALTTTAAAAVLTTTAAAAAGECGSGASRGSGIMQTSAGISSESDSRWLASQLGISMPLRGRRTATDVMTLLRTRSDGTALLDDAASLAAYAMANGILLFANTASKFARTVTLDAAAWQELQKRHHASLQQQLRSSGAAVVAAVLRCSAVAAAAAPPVPTGGLDLPPPLNVGWHGNSMSHLLIQPAVRLAVVAASTNSSSSNSSTAAGSVVSDAVSSSSGNVNTSSDSSYVNTGSSASSSSGTGETSDERRKAAAR
jgi:hypothetical protein